VRESCEMADLGSGLGGHRGSEPRREVGRKRTALIMLVVGIQARSRR
jgi:hypothetical protein